MANRRLPFLLILVLAGIFPAGCTGPGPTLAVTRQPAPTGRPQPAAVATATEIPIVLADGALTWQSAGQPCSQARFGPGGLDYGPCGGSTQHARLPADQPAFQAADLGAFVRTYSSFDAMTTAGKVTLAGQGKMPAGPDEQRMIAEWAELAWRLASQPVDPAWTTPIFTLHREGGDANLCDEVSVYRSGVAYVTSCWHGQVKELGRASLNAADLGSIFTWADGLKSFEVVQAGSESSGGPTVRLTFSGSGAAEVRHSDILSMRLMAFRLLAHPHS